MTAIVLHGDARALPLPDASMDLIVTSPPYWKKRSYKDGGKHYAGQLGGEPDFRDYLAGLWACTAEWMRVLKPEGSLFVNLDDKRASSGRAGIGEKSLMNLPHRYAIGCTDQLGLIQCAEIVWSKPDAMPEGGVTGRVQRSHEPVFHFVKQPDYYEAVDAIREAYLEPDRKRADVFGGRSAALGVRHAGAGVYTGPRNTLGKVPGSVWRIAGQPLMVPDWLGIDHFAAYPMNLARRVILGWSPPGGTVLDPFGGSGTTALVADVLGRASYTMDLSGDYCRLARWRTQDPGERARAMNVPKPLPVPVGQGSLFDDLEAS